MTMPLLTGDKLAQDLIKIRPDIPIIVSSGNLKISSKKKCDGIGIRGFLNKPLVADELLFAVKKVLDT